MDLKTLSLIGRASHMKGDLRRAIGMASRTRNAKSNEPQPMSTSTFIGEQLILLIDELSESIAEQDAKLEETENWKARREDQARNAINRMKEFVQKTSAELDDLRQERDDAMAVARLMDGRVEAALQFKSAMPQQAADHLMIASNIHASLQRSPMTNDREGAVSSKTRRHAPDSARACDNAGDDPLVTGPADL